MTTIRVADAPWLRDGPAATLLAALDRDGEEARVVGGAVRNLLLGEPIGDIDIATTAAPQETARRAGALGFKVVPTGIEHGTVTVVIDGEPFEVTTLREDIETFGRKATVKLGRDWQRDAERRDFTFNALAMTRHGDVVDLVGGLPDIEARRVRFIGVAGERIREDYLRILRFYRFHALYGSGLPDASGIAATITEREGLSTLSRERVRAELMKLLVARGAADTVWLMADAGLLLTFLGVSNPLQLARLAGLEAALELKPDWVRRLGALALHVSDDAERLGQRLRLSSQEQERLGRMSGGLADLSEQAGRALLYGVGGDAKLFLDRVLFGWMRALAPADDAGWRGLASLPERWTPPRFPLRAADLIARGLDKGPALGVALKAAEAEWIGADFPDDPATLKALADKFARA